MPAELRKIPGVGVKRYRRWHPRERDLFGPRTPRAVLPPPAVRPPLLSSVRARRRRVAAPKRSIPWSSLTVAAGCTALGLYLVNAFWSATRVDVTVAGVEDKSRIPSAALTDATVRFTADPAERLSRSTLRLDGKPVADKAIDIQGDTLSWRPGKLPEGDHVVSLAIPRPALAQSTFKMRFTVDDTPPRLDVPPLLPHSGICQAVSVRGEVERGAALTLDGQPLAHKGTFTVRYDRPPAKPLRLVATDQAGNQTSAEVIAPVRYPGGQGVHVTAAAWGYEPLRRGILALIDAGLVSAIELDLKDEGGLIGYDSRVPLANLVGAVQPEYRLKETVADLKRRGVRVIGRIVAFRDAPLADWAWKNNRREWVVQDDKGGASTAYGGFTNPANPEVHAYNLAIALEAVDAGVDDILWDYVRRPEGDPATMVFPGMQGTPSEAVVQFLATSHAALRERCVFQGAAVFGIAADRPDAVGQNIPAIARHVEYVAPMLYPSHWVPGEYGVENPNRQPFDIIKATLADFQVKMAGTGTALVPWLQDFTLGHPYTRTEVRAQIEAARQLGVEDWLLWNAGAVYTAGALDPSLVKLRP